MEDLTENLVSQSNQLVEATYSMSLGEIRILEACISMVDSRERLEKNDMFVLTVEQAIDLFYTEENQRNVFRDLSASCKALMKREATIQLNDDETLVTHFVSAVKFNKRERRVELRFAYDILPYISALERQFTSYKLKYTQQFSSVYAHRLYHLLVMWIGQGLSYKEMELRAFKDSLDIGDKYKSFNLLNIRVLEPAIAQINEHSDVFVDAHFRKRGRAYHWLQLRFNRKPEIAAAAEAAKRERIERQQHNAEAKEKRIETERQETKEAVDKAQQAAMSAYFTQVKKGSLYIDEEGKEWEFDGSWLNSVSGRSVIMLDAAYQAIQSGQLRPLSPLSDDQKEREYLEALGQQRLFNRKEKK